MATLRSIPLASVILGAVAGLAVVGLHEATAQGAAGAKAGVEGWKVEGRYDAAAWPGMEFELHVKNAASQGRPLQMTAKLIQTEFKGNRFSRVVMPNDIVATTLESRRVTGVVAAGQTKTVSLTFKARAEAEAEKSPSGPGKSYALVVELDGVEVQRLGVAPLPHGP